MLNCTCPASLLLKLAYLAMLSIFQPPHTASSDFTDLPLICISFYSLQMDACIDVQLSLSCPLHGYFMHVIPVRWTEETRQTTPNQQFEFIVVFVCDREALGRRMRCVWFLSTSTPGRWYRPAPVYRIPWPSPNPTTSLSSTSSRGLDQQCRPRWDPSYVWN